MMTNEEYIHGKRIAKFNMLWNFAMQKLVAVSARSAEEQFIEVKGKTYYFNKQSNKQGGWYLVCRRSVPQNGKISDKKAYTMAEVCEIFSDYDSYEKETIKILARLKYQKDTIFWNEGLNLRDIENSIFRYSIQREYIEAFFRYLKCSVKREKEYVELNETEIVAFVNKKRAEQKLNGRYFEFKEYSANGLKKLLNVAIEEILIRERHTNFVEFCKRNELNTLHFLLFIPYYNRALCKRFGVDVMEQIIKDVRSYLDLKILYEEAITIEDLEDLFDEF